MTNWRVSIDEMWEKEWEKQRVTIKDTAKWREGSPTQHRLEQSYLGGCRPSDLMRATEMLRRWRASTAPAQPVRGTSTRGLMPSVQPDEAAGTHNSSIATTHNINTDAATATSPTVAGTHSLSLTPELPGELVPLVPEEESNG